MSHLYVLRRYTLSVYHCRLIFGRNSIVHLTGRPLLLIICCYGLSRTSSLCLKTPILPSSTPSVSPFNRLQRVIIDSARRERSCQVYTTERAIIDLVRCQSLSVQRHQSYRQCVTVQPKDLAFQREYLRFCTAPIVQRHQSYCHLRQACHHSTERSC
jgi:hypothetical protein